MMLRSPCSRWPKCAPMPGQELTEALATWLGDGSLTPLVAEVLPLERIAEAHHLAEQGAHGDVIVSPTPAPRLAAVV